MQRSRSVPASGNKRGKVPAFRTVAGDARVVLQMEDTHKTCTSHASEVADGRPTSWAWLTWAVSETATGWSLKGGSAAHSSNGGQASQFFFPIFRARNGRRGRLAWAALLQRTSDRFLASDAGLSSLHHELGALVAPSPPTHWPFLDARAEMEEKAKTWMLHIFAAPHIAGSRSCDRKRRRGEGNGRK